MMKGLLRKRQTFFVERFLSLVKRRRDTPGGGALLLFLKNLSGRISDRGIQKSHPGQRPDMLSHCPDGVLLFLCLKYYV